MCCTIQGNTSIRVSFVVFINQCSQPGAQDVKEDFPPLSLLHCSHPIPNNTQKNGIYMLFCIKEKQSLCCCVQCQTKLWMFKGTSQQIKIIHLLIKFQPQMNVEGITGWWWAECVLMLSGCFEMVCVSSQEFSSPGVFWRFSRQCPASEELMVHSPALVISVTCCAASAKYLFFLLLLCLTAGGIS